MFNLNKPDDGFTSGPKEDQGPNPVLRVNTDLSDMVQDQLLKQ